MDFQNYKNTHLKSYNKLRKLRKRYLYLVLFVAVILFIVLFLIISFQPTILTITMYVVAVTTGIFSIGKLMSKADSNDSSRREKLMFLLYSAYADIFVSIHSGETNRIKNVRKHLSKFIKKSRNADIGDFGSKSEDTLKMFLLDSIKHVEDLRSKIQDDCSEEELERIAKDLQAIFDALSEENYEQVSFTIQEKGEVRGRKIFISKIFNRISPHFDIIAGVLLVGVFLGIYWLWVTFTGKNFDLIESSVFAFGAPAAMYYGIKIVRTIRAKD